MSGIGSNSISQVWKDTYYQVSARPGQVKAVSYLTTGYCTYYRFMNLEVLCVYIHIGALSAVHHQEQGEANAAGRWRPAAIADFY